MKIKFLITGASGMLGKSLISQLKKKNYTFLAPSSKELNLLNLSSIKKYLNNKKPNYIIHLAGFVGGIGANMNDPIKFLHSNMLMGMNLIDMAHKMKIKNFLNIGSSCIYPTKENRSMSESKLLSGDFEKTNEGYALAKLSIIKFCEYVAKSKGYNYFSLIPCNIYGPNDNFDEKTGHVVSSLIDRIYCAKKNNLKTVEIWGTGKSKREFIYVDDVSKAILKFLFNKKIIKKNLYWLNIGMGSDLSIKNLYLKISKLIGYKGSFVHNLNKPDGTARKLLNIKKAKNFGWTPKVKLIDGLKKTIDWYIKMEQFK
jgi:nucleoside-diphosphate-sugar epimerase